MKLVRTMATPNINDDEKTDYHFEVVDEDGKGTGKFYMLTLPTGTINPLQEIELDGPTYDIDEKYEEQYFKMNPKTETLLLDGRELQSNMVVLIGDDTFRRDPAQVKWSVSQDILDAHLYVERMDRYNRWGKIVSKIKLYENEKDIGFILEYPDGSMKKIMVPVHYAWYVKKSTIPEQDSNE